VDAADEGRIRDDVARALRGPGDAGQVARAAAAALAAALGASAHLLVRLEPQAEAFGAPGPVPPDVAEIARAWQREGAPAAGARTATHACLPLASGSRLLGVLAIPASTGADLAAPGVSEGLAIVALALQRALLEGSLVQARAEAAALQSIDAALGEDRDPIQIYHVIAREAGLVLRGDTVLALLDRERVVQAEAAHGERALHALEDDGALSGDVRRAVREGRVLALPSRGATVHVAPLRSRDRQLGALVAVVDGPGDAGPALARLADKAGQAVTRLRDRQAEAKRLGQLALVSAAAEIAASTLDLPSLVGAIARYVQTSFSYYSVTIYLVDAEAKEAFLAGAAGASAQVIPRSHRMPFGHGIIGWVAQRGEHVLAPDVRREPRFVLSEMVATLSELAVPVKLAGEVVAVINVESDQVGDFDGSDLFAVDAIASQVASAIRNARLFDEKVRALRTLEIVQEITNDLNSHLEEGELLARIARRSVEAVRPAHRGAVMLYDGEALTVRSSHGYVQPEALGRVRLAFHEGLPGSVFVSGSGRAQRGQADDYGSQAAAFAEACGGVASCFALCVPIALPEEKLGVLLLESTAPHEGFDTSGLRLAGTLAHQAAIAMGNALRLAQVLEMDRQRQEYLSNVSHELRSPLTVIQGYVEALATGTAGEKTGAFLEVALEQCQRLARRIDEVLEVSRLEQGVARRHLKWEPVSVDRLVGRVVQPLRAEAAVRRLALQAQIQPASVVGDERLIHMLVRSLVDNAIKFTPAGGRVDVELHATADEAVLSVADTGIGIAPEHHDHIFDKFFMVDSGLQRARGGAGIGLFLAREIVQIHSGRLDVASVPGGGARFVVHLPTRPRG
jgi:signal transduction histidine kinase/putative methionine-R-sulfoxide reductase with GAF domain